MGVLDSDDWFVKKYGDDPFYSKYIEVIPGVKAKEHIEILEKLQRYSKYPWTGMVDDTSGEWVRHMDVSPSVSALKSYINILDRNYASAKMALDDLRQGYVDDMKKLKEENSILRKQADLLQLVLKEIGSNQEHFSAEFFAKIAEYKDEVISGIRKSTLRTYHE